MSTTGGSISLQDIRNDLKNTDLTGTQKKQAFEHLRHWLRDRPDDTEAKDLWARYEHEFGREGADIGDREVTGTGFEAVSEAQERARQTR